MIPFKFSHIGLAVANMEQALKVYRSVFGYTLRSGPFDDPIQKVSVCFLASDRPGDVTLELVAPAGESSPISKFVQKGVCAYHLCYEVDDLNQALNHVRTQGCIVVSEPVPAVAFEGRRIAWFYTPDRQLAELIQQ
jgi:methylmalonyl-CoA/ethylmalonyl-CoA epimerase